MPTSLAERNTELIRRLYLELFQHWRLELIDELFAPDFRSTEIPASLPAGPTGVRRFYASLRAAFPDLIYEVDDLLAQGDKVCVRWRWRAHHGGDFRGVPPSGRAVALSGIAIYELRDGLITRRWVEGDTLGLLRTLGFQITPPPSEPSTP